MPIPIWYTFGNHMHWVDMQWLWGYHVLPGSVRDMLHFCRETGAKGNVNFDGVGYEKLAAEAPEVLAELRSAVQDGTIEVVGASYGQPYGLFHGGESNIRQRIYGVRAVMRLLGVRPKTFWEEEFDFFPQLPQILRGVGFEYASLFFQWTWHTPEIPKEEAPVIWWEGHDGSCLLTATRNRLNLHQWPEDIDILLNDLAENPPEGEAMIQQWLELMPSPDWMCRSEVLLPKTKELLSDPRFEFRFGTLSECIKGGTSFQDVVSSGFQPEYGGPADELSLRQGAYLPHLTKKAGTYAVSFRLADALPQPIQHEIAIERERLRELEDRGLIHTEATKQEYRRLFAEKIENALAAGHGGCVLKESGAAQIVKDALHHFHGSRYRLHAWCVMPNHVHAIVEPLGSHDLSGILHSWKSFTANEINKLIGRKGPLWQVEAYDHLIRGPQDYESQVRYVLDNPRKAGLSNWPWVGQVDTAFNAPEDQYAAVLGLEAREDHDLEGRATPVRKYSMDDVWHGMSLGKNGDRMRRLSSTTEGALLTAEALASMAGLFGRSYPQWDVYPTWELEEAWRELLQAQHHDNDECEELCGHVGRFSYDRSRSLSQHVVDRIVDQVSERISGPPDSNAVFNPLGWARKWDIVTDEEEMSVVEVPAFGYALTPKGKYAVECGMWTLEGSIATFKDEHIHVVVDTECSTILEFKNAAMPDGLPDKLPLFKLLGKFGGEDIQLTSLAKSPDTNIEFPQIPGDLVIRWRVNLTDRDHVVFNLRIPPHVPGALDLTVTGFLPKPDPGMNPAIAMELPWSRGLQIVADQPYSVTRLDPHGTFLKKYPTGDWMTSPQWFEEVHRPYTALTFVDFVREDGSGVLVAHDGSQQWFVQEDGTSKVLLSMFDPWDERFTDHLDANFRFLPHEPLTDSARWKTAQEFVRPCEEAYKEREGGDLPQRFGFVACAQENVVIAALHRETGDTARYQEEYAAREFEVDYPYVLRLVELDGVACEAELSVAGTVAAAYKTNALGETILGLEARGDHDLEGRATVSVAMRPYEIATLYLDIVEGRKQTRDLDAARNVWATVHRVEDE